MILKIMVMVRMDWLSNSDVGGQQVAGLHLDHDDENHYDSSDNVDDDYEDHDDGEHGLARPL